MHEDKKFAGGWWIWILFLTIITILVFGVARVTGLIGYTVVERVVFENSFQYKKGEERQNNTMRASLAEINARLQNPDLTEGERADLQAQKSALNIQLQRY